MTGVVRRRRGCGVAAVPVSGEVLDRVERRDVRVEAVAYPVQTVVPQTVRILVEQAPVAAAPPVQVGREGPSWATAAVFMSVVCVLLAIGVGLWFDGSPPWERDAAQQRHSAPAHHGGSTR